MVQLTKEDAQAYKARWAAVNAAEIEELRAMTPEESFRQFVGLFRMAEQMGWTEELAAEEEVARERWNRLRKRWNEKHGRQDG